MVAIKECPTTGRVVEKLEYHLPNEVVLPEFAAFGDEDDRYIARQIYLKKLEKNLN